MSGIDGLGRCVTIFPARTPGGANAHSNAGGRCTAYAEAEPIPGVRLCLRHLDTWRRGGFSPLRPEAWRFTLAPEVLGDTGASPWRRKLAGRRKVAAR